MNHGNWARRVVFLLTALALASSACSATETVTINQDAIAAATSTVVQDDPPPAEDVVDDPAGADNRTTTTLRDSGPIESGCAFAFVDSFGDIQIEIEFANPLLESSDASVPYDVFDGDGELLGSNQITLENLSPGEGVRVDVDTRIDEPTDAGARSGISCALTEIEPLAFSFDGTSPGSSDSCRFVEVDSFDDIQVELTVTNPFEDSADIIVDYVLRGADGVRFGDSVAFLEVLPGESVTVENDTVTEFPAWVSESTFSCQILSIDDF